MRMIKYSQAINEALDVCLRTDPTVYVIGLGVPDPKGVFGTTAKLVDRHGPQRVLDMPASENAMTGIAIGSALTGMRPVLVHCRLDFALLSVDQLVNQAAKWHYMFGGQASVPLVVRMIVGRGWGQGSQHSQSLQSWFAHIPGLKVILPATPYDAKGMMIAAVRDNNPVISIEHRWLFDISGPVPDEDYEAPLGRARVVRDGTDITIVAMSHMTIEAIRAAEALDQHGISAEVVDLRTLRPLDHATIVASVRKTGRLLVAETGWTSYGASAEIISVVAEQALSSLQTPPRRLGLADCPSPCTPALASRFFPSVGDIVNTVRDMFELDAVDVSHLRNGIPDDVPDNCFAGPF